MYIKHSSQTASCNTALSKQLSYIISEENTQNSGRHKGAAER